MFKFGSFKIIIVIIKQLASEHKKIRVCLNHYWVKKDADKQKSVSKNKVLKCKSLDMQSLSLTLCSE